MMVSRYPLTGIIRRGILPVLVVISWALCAAPPLVAQAVKIMPMGDSITRGSRGDGMGGRADVPGGYRRNLGLLLAANGTAYDFVGDRTDNAAPGMDPDHNGLDGWRTDQMLAVLASRMAKNPDVVLLKAGTNDILQQRPLAAALRDLEIMMMEILMPRPDRRLFVATVIPIQSAWGNGTQAEHQANANLYNAQLRAIAAGHAAAGRNVFLMDFDQLITLIDPDPSKNFFQPGDGIHPGPAGYDQMGALWHAALTSVPGFANPPPTGIPAKRTGLAANTVTPSRVNLTWNNPASDATAIEIWSRNLNDGVWQVAATLPGDATSHALTGLDAINGQYRIAINAINANGGSGWSAMVTSAAFSGSTANLALQKPASATSQFSTSHSPDKANDGAPSTIWASTGIAAHWWQVDLLAPIRLGTVEIVTRQDNSDVEVQRRLFEVRASNDPTFATYTTLGAQGETPLPHKATLAIGVTDPTPFRYLRVAKTVAESFSLAEVRVFGIPELSPPATPASLSASALASDQVRLDWVIASDNESAFRVERKTPGDGEFAAVAMPAALAEFHEDDGLDPATTYLYRVFAVNEAGDSDPSPEVAVTTPEPGEPPPPAPPAKRSGLSAATVSPSRVNLSWTNPDTRADVIEIWSRPFGGGTWEKTAELPGTASGHGITGLATQADRYDFALNALNSTGGSGFSATVSSTLLVGGTSELADAKPAAASSAWSASHTADKANDNTTATLWSSTGLDFHWWQVDLLDAAAITRVDVVARQDTHDIAAQRRNFEVRASNDPAFDSYTVLGSQGETAFPHKGTFTAIVSDPTPYRYVRVQKTVNTESFSIALVRVFGGVAVLPPAAPSALAATLTAPGRALLEWTIASDNESAFRIERAAGADGEFVPVATLPALADSYEDDIPTGPGTYRYRVIAVNEGGESVPSPEAVIVLEGGDPYEAWAAGFPDFMALPADQRLPGADPNGNGIPNLLAYAFGLDPLAQADPARMPAVHFIDGGEPPRLAFSFTRNPAASDLAYLPQRSTLADGDMWEILALDDAIITPADGESGLDRVTVPLDPPPDQTADFFRVKVTRGE